MLDKLHDALKLRTNPAIFFSSAAVIIIFVLGTIFFTDQLDAGVSVASDWLLTNLGWFYILGVTVFVALYHRASVTGERARLTTNRRSIPTAPGSPCSSPPASARSSCSGALPDRHQAIHRVLPSASNRHACRRRTCHELT